MEEKTLLNAEYKVEQKKGIKLEGKFTGFWVYERTYPDINKTIH